MSTPPIAGSFGLSGDSMGQEQLPPIACLSSPANSGSVLRPVARLPDWGNMRKKGVIALQHLGSGW